MDLDLIERLMRMLEQSALNELDVTEAGMRVRLVKQTAAAMEPAASAPDVRATPSSEAATDAPSPRRRLVAGMAGTFYRSPSPGAPPFIEIGRAVREGDQLAIIEAMKLLNPVEASEDGVICAILPADGASVEPGDVLFEIETG